MLALFFPEIGGIVAAIALLRDMSDAARAGDGDDDEDAAGGDVAPPPRDGEPEAEHSDFLYVITFPVTRPLDPLRSRRRAL